MLKTTQNRNSFINGPVPINGILIINLEIYDTKLKVYSRCFVDDALLNDLKRFLESI